MTTRRCRYSCDSAAQTLEWMNAIADFLRPFKPLLDAHVVNFFKDKLWETVDKQWIEYLGEESVENLLNIPSGLVMDCWPPSLQEFILTLGSLVLPREKKLLEQILPDLHVTSLGSVLAQGMNLKKKHEVEILAAVVSKIASGVGAQTVIDVGSGQGYLAQALSFQYQLSVVAIDASSHHATVTSARAERIKKHYAAKLRKSQHGNGHLKVPQTVTCHVLSSDILTTLSTASLQRDSVEQESEVENHSETGILESLKANISNQYNGSSLVLAGLHACGDLSVNMLRTFVDHEQVKALVSVGCCYNLLSEECSEKTSTPCGFPMSNAAKLSGLIRGKNVRDLACQSADRWRSLTKDAVIQNFELHTFRAAFQMSHELNLAKLADSSNIFYWNLEVLDKYYPEVLTSSPSVGRQGKSLRRQQLRRVRESRLDAEKNNNYPSIASIEQSKNKDDECATSEALFPSRSCFDTRCKETNSFEISQKYALFEEFSKSALDRLGFSSTKDTHLLEIWNKTQPFYKFVGPYWSLRAALGPLVETYLLLDRLLFLQEQDDSMQAMLFPLFDPTLSPRNMAIMALKSCS